MSRGWAWIISIVSGWKISLSFPSYCCFLALPSGLCICCFGCLEWMWNGERLPHLCVCVCTCVWRVWAMKRVTKRKTLGDGVCLGISMLRVSALDVPLSPSPSLILSLTHQSLSPQCPWQLYHQNTPAKEDNCNLSTAERLRGRVSEIVCARARFLTSVVSVCGWERESVHYIVFLRFSTALWESFRSEIKEYVCGAERTRTIHWRHMHTLTVLIMCITTSFLKLKVRGGNSKQSFSKEEFYQKAGETVAMAQLDSESSVSQLHFVLKWYL